MEKNIKLIVWHGVVGVLAWMTWSMGRNLAFDPVTGLGLQFPSVLAFIFLAAVMVLGYIMFRQLYWAFSMTAIVGSLFMMSFGWNGLDLIAILILLALNIWAAIRVRREIVERRVLNITDAFYHGLWPVVLGLFVMISFAAYQSPLLEQIKTAQTLPTRTQVFFQQVVDNTLGTKIEAATPQQRNQLINEIARQTFQEVNKVLQPYFQYAPPVLSFGLFLILWGLSFIFIWLSAGAGLAIYWILKKSGVIRIEEKEVKAEILVV